MKIWMMPLIKKFDLEQHLPFALILSATDRLHLHLLFVALVSSLTQQLSLYILYINIFKPFFGHSTILHDLFKFVNQFQEFQTSKTNFLVSFDLKSLFTTIPLDFTLSLILDRLFIDQSIKIFGMNGKHFKKLLNSQWGSLWHRPLLTYV